MNTARTPIAQPGTVPARDRLWTVAEQLRLAAVVLNTMSRAPLADPAIADHVDRLEHRAAELMRSAARLGEVLGVTAPWGLDVLFQPAAAPEPAPRAPTRPRALGPARRKHCPTPPAGLAESIELAPFELLSPEIPPAERRPRPTRALPPPIPAPLGRGEDDDADVTLFDFDRV